MQASNKDEINTVLHFSDLFARIVKPKMQEEYTKKNNGTKLGAYTIDKDGNEKMLDDIISENAPIKAKYGTQ